MKPKLFRISTVPVSLNILLKGQLEYLNQFYEVTAISGAGEDFDEVAEREGVKLHPIEIERKISPFRDLISLYRLYRYFKKEKPDIIHSISPKAGLLSMVAGKFAGVPVRVHTFTGLIFPYRTGLMQQLLMMMDKILCHCATKVIPEGEGVKSDLLKYKITDKPLRKIGSGNINGIDLHHYNLDHISDNQRTTLKKSLKISENDLVLVFVGRMVRDKGINELVQAFSNISNRNFNSLKGGFSGNYDLDEPKINVKLLLVGAFEHKLDPLKPETLKEIEENPDILSVGFQKDVRPYFAISDCLVFPSYREGFPNVLLQSLAMEVPAIVTNISGCNEIIRNTMNGLIIEPKSAQAIEDALIYLAKNPWLFFRMKKRTRNGINRFYQKKLWHATKAEYDKLLNSHQELVSRKEETVNLSNVSKSAKEEKSVFRKIFAEAGVRF